MIKRIVDRQVARFRRASRPWRHSLELAAGTLLTPGLQIPLQPWKSASMPEDAEIVARLPGQFEPPRRVRVFGDQQVPMVGRPVERSAVLDIRLLRNVILLPHRMVLSQQERRILPPAFQLPSNSGRHFAERNPNGGFRYKRYAPLRRRPQAITTPVFLADTLHAGYGHQLLEMVPMLLAREALATPTVVASTHAPIADLAAPFSVTGAGVLRIDRPLFCNEVFVADPPLDLMGNVHSVARTAFERLGRLADKSTIETPERIFLSRLNWPGRALVNEAEVHELFRRYGFTTVSPEAHSLADQIRLFASAEMVAGAGGSAMHNLVFSPPSTKALFLSSPHWFVSIDRYLSRADDQFGFVIGSSAPSPSALDISEQPFSIDLALVEHAIREHFGL